MARRRLNKKVALLGSMVLLLMALGAVVVLLSLSRDPAQFIADGDAARAAGDSESARRHYSRAVALTKAPQERIDLYFKLAEVHREVGDWQRVLGAWTQIILSDPQNLRARTARLKYCYILADSLSEVGQSMQEYWDEALKQSMELIAVAESAGVLDEPKAQWEPSFGAAEDARWGGGAALLGPCLRFIGGRAAFEIARLGSVTSPDKLLDDAQSSLEKARELDPNNAQVYHLLSQVALQKGERAASRGGLQEKEAAVKRAGEILAEGVAAAGGAPQAHINLLARRFADARTGGVVAVRAQMQALQPEYDALVERFPGSPRVLGAAAEFYGVYSAYCEFAKAGDILNRAIEAARKACDLDPNNVPYARFAARLYHRKHLLLGDASALERATELAERALALPDAQDVAGPRQLAGQVNRLSLCAFLARCCVEQILALAPSSPQRAELLARAEEAVYEIEQIRGSGQNPQVVMWQGMLELARGHTGKAVRNLYATYEQIKASSAPQERDAFLSYTLAGIFKGTSEIGAVVEFLGSALGAGIIDSKPEALLDYGEVLVQARSYDASLNAIGVFDERFGQTDRSKALRIEALIAKGHISEAEESLSRLEDGDPNSLRLGIYLARAKGTQLRGALRQEHVTGDAPTAAAPDNADGQANGEQTTQALAAELRDCRRREADLMRRLLKVSPGTVDEQDIVRLCESLIAQQDAVVAAGIVEVFLAHRPQSVEALFYRAVLSEPDPANCPEARREEIREQAILGMTDPLRRAVELGVLYRQQEQWDKAVSQWRQVLDATTSQTDGQEPAYLRARELSPRHLAAGHLFDLARHREDWRLAEETAGIARNDNLDDCGGELFAARLALAQGENRRALTHLDECLRQRPIFSYGYMLRGNVHAALGDERAAIEDLRKATDLNPVDPLVAKALANALYVRNGQLGERLSSEQELETRQAFERAIYLDPRDANLLTVYAGLIGASDPMKALALHQTIQANTPSVQNGVMLGKLATQIAAKERDMTRREALLKIAESAFEQARQMEPGNQLLLENYAAYYRVTGQNDKAVQLLVESQDRQLLWRHYFRIGRYDDARKLLEQMYGEQANKADALKGLILIAEETADKDAVKKYSQELLTLEDNLVNRLGQIRVYLDVGLLQEAQHRVQSFKEKYPDEPRIVLIEALLAKRQGDLDRALQLANLHLKDNEEDASVWRLRGEIYFLQGEYDRAVADLHRSRRMDGDPVTTTMLAKAYLWAGRREEAVSELQGVLEKPGAPEDARVLLESIYLRLGRHEALEQFYADTLAIFPDSVEWLNRAGAFAINRQEYARAEELYKKAYRLRQQNLSDLAPADAVRDPQYAAALDGYLLALVRAAGEQGAAGDAWRPEKLDTVLQEGGRYLDTPYAAAALCRMAEAKKKLGELQTARQYCREAVDKAWNNERVATEILFRAYLVMGDEEVLKYCHERLRTDPNSLVANYTMFNLATIRQTYDEAVGYIDRCIELSPPDSPRHTEYMARKAQVLAVAYKTTSDNAHLERAVAVYESLLAKTPKNNHVVLNNLAYMLAQSGRRLPDALEYAAEALEQDPDEANYMDTYAYVLHRNGRNAEAVRSLTAAIQQYEVQGAAPAEVYEHLGMVHEALGETQKALAAYRRALEVGTGTMSDIVKERIDSAIGRLGQ